jgi:hypothetical protein
VVVFDAETEAQELTTLQDLAGELSRRHHCVTLAVLNHDDGVLRYWLHDDGNVIDEYNSWPGYFSGGDAVPSGGDANALCAAFGVADRAADVERILRAPRSSPEVDRHAALVGVLGLPRAAVGTGFEYIAKGELPEKITQTDLRLVGSAVMALDPAVQAVYARLKALVQPSEALSAIIGADPLPYQSVGGAVYGYLSAHGLVDEAPPYIVTMDEPLRAVFGVDRMPYHEMSFVLERHLSPVVDPER